MKTGPQCEGCQNAVEGTVTVQVDGRTVEERDVVVCPLDECAPEREGGGAMVTDEERREVAENPRIAIDPMRGCVR